MFIPSPPFFLIYFLFSFSPYCTSSILHPLFPHPPSSILHPLSSPIPYPLSPIPLSFPSSFHLQSISPFSTPHSSLLTPHSSLLLPPPPPFPPPFSSLLFSASSSSLTHTHNPRHAISLQSFFFIKEYGTFSIVCPATWFIKKVRMGLKGV